MDNQRDKQRLRTFFALLIFSLVLFIPASRAAISLAERCLGRPLSKTLCQKTLFQLNCLFLLGYLAVMYAGNARRRANIYAFFDTKLKGVSTDEWLHYIPLAVFVLVLCTIHFRIVETGDDGYFSRILSSESLTDFLRRRYAEWSSRLLIEAVLVHCYAAHFGLWRFFNVVACVIIAECMVRIVFGQKGRYAAVVYATLLLFTHRHSLQSAGWGATTVNYVWPLAAAMPGFVTAQTILERKRPSVFSQALSLLLLVFAANHEQLAALSAGLYLSFFALRLAQNHTVKKQDVYFMLAIALCVLSVGFILTCPGNKVRFGKEIKTWFPEYGGLTVFGKIELGILTIGSYYFSLREANCVIIPLCLALTAVFYKRNKKAFTLQLALDAFIVACPIFDRLTDNFLFSNIQLVQFSPHSFGAVFAECATFALLSALFLRQTYTAMGDKTDGLTNCFLLCAGFCSAFIIAFSPTVYASGSRCYVFMSCTVFLVAFRIFYRYWLGMEAAANAA